MTRHDNLPPLKALDHNLKAFQIVLCSFLKALDNRIFVFILLGQSGLLYDVSASDKFCPKHQVSSLCDFHLVDRSVD